MEQKPSMPKWPNVNWVLADHLRAQALRGNGEVDICTPGRDMGLPRAGRPSPTCCAARAITRPISASGAWTPGARPRTSAPTGRRCISCGRKTAAAACSAAR